jgi:hypothetical protein
MMTTELVLVWRTSRYSNGGDNCVQWAPHPGGMIVRDSKDPDGPTITIAQEQWPVFLADALTGHATDTAAVAISTGTDRRTYRGVATLTVWHLHCRATDVTLHFTAGERDAFLAEIRDSVPALDADRALATH